MAVHVPLLQFDVQSHLFLVPPLDHYRRLLLWPLLCLVAPPMDMVVPQQILIVQEETVVFTYSLIYLTSF